MDQVLFQGFTDDQREAMLEANADEITKGRYTKRFSGHEKNERRKRNAEIDIELAKINEEYDEVKKEFKERKEPLLDEKKTILEEIKAGGKFVEGKLYKIVDREKKEVGYYDEDGFLVEQRRMTSEDRQASLHIPLTGTDD